MEEFPVADDAPEGDVLSQDCLLGMGRDVNAFHACDARAAITANERARVH
jgi:hypothetical protein